jgi:hypothetical protein
MTGCARCLRLFRAGKNRGPSINGSLIKSVGKKIKRMRVITFKQKRGLRPLLACYVPSGNLQAAGDLVELLDFELQNVRYSHSGQFLRFREGVKVIRCRFQRACFEVKIIF